MRVSVARRIAALEAKLQPKKAVDNLDREIKAMTAIERNALRDFLLVLKDGGRPCDEGFDKLKRCAEEAVLSARERLSMS